MSNAVALRAFGTMLEKSKVQLSQHSINGIAVERIISGAKLAAATNPDLLKCSPQSVMIGVYQAARLGLELGGPMGRAYLIPFKGKAQLIVGYKGMIELALRSGRITSIIARIVRQGDVFEPVQGSSESLTHIPQFPPVFTPATDDEPAKAMPVIAAYAVATLAGGGTVFDWMPIHEVEVIRAGREGPWVTDYEQMVRKTLIRRLSNVLPMTPELAAAVELLGRELDETGAPVVAENIAAPAELVELEDGEFEVTDA